MKKQRLRERNSVIVAVIKFCAGCGVGWSVTQEAELRASGHSDAAGQPTPAKPNRPMNTEKFQLGFLLVVLLRVEQNKQTLREDQIW